jgi:hypothetical protein
MEIVTNRICVVFPLKMKPRNRRKYQAIKFVISRSRVRLLQPAPMKSFDEVIVTTFTAGQQRTLPIWMLSELIRPTSDRSPLSSPSRSSS